MKAIINLIIIFSLTGCNYFSNLNPTDTKLSRSSKMQKQINRLLKRDSENKRLEKIYLEEIRIAEQNNDQETFKFYLSEYIKVERLNIPAWMKQEPNYVQGGVSIKY